MDISAVDPNFRRAEVGGLPVQYADALAGGVFRLSGFPWRDADGTLYPLQILFNGQAGFAPCAAPWGKLTLTMPLEAGEEKLLA